MSDVTWCHVTSRPVTSRPVRSGQVRSGQVRSDQVRSGQIRSGQVRSGQVRSGQVTSRHVTSRHVTSRHVTLCVVSRYVVSRRVMSRHVTHALSPSLSLTYDHTNTQSDTYVRTFITCTHTGAYADGRTHVHLEIYMGIYSWTFTPTITSKRTPVKTVSRAPAETAWPRMPLEPTDAGKPPGSWENRCRKGSNPPFVRFHPFPKFPGKFGIHKFPEILETHFQIFPEILEKKMAAQNFRKI